MRHVLRNYNFCGYLGLIFGLILSSSVQAEVYALSSGSDKPRFGSPEAACLTKTPVNTWHAIFTSNKWHCTKSGSYVLLWVQPECPVGTWLDPALDQCVPGEPPPPGPAPGCQGYEPGGAQVNAIWLDDPPNGINEFCSPDYSTDEEECSDVAGYFNDVQICNDDQNECEAKGGSYGIVVYETAENANDSAKPVCIPPEYAEQLPTCDIPSLQIVENPGNPGTGGFVCASPVTPPEPGDPTEKPGDHNDPNDPVPPSCTGADCDSGTGTCQGPDCVQTPGTEGEKSSVGGGGTCESKPTCKGDAVLCSINYQLWRTRCEDALDGAEVTGAGTCESPFVCKNDPVQCAILKTLHDTRCDGADFDLAGFISANDPESLKSTVDLEPTITGIFNTSSPVGSCPAPLVLNVAGITLNISFEPFCEFALMIRPFLLIIFGLISIRIVMRAF